jgi:putative molybdopterin biosynthesis protein
MKDVHDLTREDIIFVNRHAGSGTRVYLDSLLRRNGIDPALIRGYANQKTTHSEIAAEIAEDHADVGLGLEAAAKAYSLDFIFLNLERYDLVVKAKLFNEVPIQNMIAWLKGEEFRLLLNRLGGYGYSESGDVHWT